MVFQVFRAGMLSGLRGVTVFRTGGFCAVTCLELRSWKPLMLVTSSLKGGCRDV